MKHFPRVLRQSLSIISLLALLASTVPFAIAQRTAAAKRPLTHADYDTWRSIVSPQISRDGKFVAYAYMSQDADSDIVVRNISTGKEFRAPRGYRPPAPPPDVSLPNSAEIVAEQARLVRPIFTADTRFVAFSIEPAKTELNKAKKEKKRPEEMPKNSLGLMSLSNGQVAKIERVKNFQVPEDAGGFIAYLREAKPSGNPTVREGASAGRMPAVPAEAEGPTNTTTPVATPSPNAPFKEGSTSPEVAGAPATSPSPIVREGSSEPPAIAGGQPRSGSGAGRTPATPGGKKKDYGTDLVLGNTTTGAERTFNDVLEYTLSKDAKTLVFTVSSKKEETNGVYVVSTQSAAAPVAVLSGKGKYQKLTWDEEQTELAFVSDRDDADAKQSRFKVYLWERGSAPTA